MSCRGGLEGRNRLDGDGRLGKQVEQLRQMRLHLRDVLAKVLDDGVGGCGDVLGVALHMIAEAGEVLVAVGLGQRGHFAGDAIHFLEADLVNLRGGQVSGGETAQRGLVAALASAQRVDGKRGAAVGNVIRGNKGRELLVSREDFVVDRGGDLVSQALLVGLCEAGGELLEREKERVGGNHAICLIGESFRR